MGVLSMMVPEADGGLGGDFVDAILLIEELGRAAVPGPVFETMAVGAPALAGDPWSQRARRRHRSWSRRRCWASGTYPTPTSPTSSCSLTAPPVRAVEAAGSTSTAVDGIDGGRRLATLAGTDSAPVVVRGRRSGAARPMRVRWRRPPTCSGCRPADARRSPATTPAIAEQFGQPIGSFQAVKHLMADALLKVEFARPAIYRAAWSFATDHPHRGSRCQHGQVPRVRRGAEGGPQRAAGARRHRLHVGVRPAAVMKKAWALHPSVGDATFHRRRVADAVLGPR